MRQKTIYSWLSIACLITLVAACKTPQITEQSANVRLPQNYGKAGDSLSSGTLAYNAFFKDPYLVKLIDTALAQNQELNIMLKEIEISQNEVMARKGEYMPFVSYRGGMGLDKVARYTNIGASEATTDIKPGRETPEPLPDFLGGLYANWEVDIWHKLRNARQAAFTRYLSSVEGRNFMVTNLVAEIANSYYELLALDNQLQIVRQNIDIQNNALQIVKIQKEGSRATELAVRKFEAEVYRTKSLEYDVKQEIIAVENRINYLVGRYPQAIERSSNSFDDLLPTKLSLGNPQQLLENRTDVKAAELRMAAAKIDIAVAKANFYPSLGLSASLGLQSFNPIYLAKLPESMLASLVGDLVGPLVNKNAITAQYYNANASQIQAIYDYERTVLNAYIEVLTQTAGIDNLAGSYELKANAVKALSESIQISNDLYLSARADYMEVLLTQRDALESKFELVETKKQQLSATVNLYHALGGGWK